MKFSQATAIINKDPMLQQGAFAAGGHACSAVCSSSGSGSSDSSSSRCGGRADKKGSSRGNGSREGWAGQKRGGGEEEVRERGQVRNCSINEVRAIIT